MWTAGEAGHKILHWEQEIVIVGLEKKKKRIVSSNILFSLVYKPFLPSRTAHKVHWSQHKQTVRQALSDFESVVASVEASALLSPYQISGMSDITQQMQNLLQLAKLVMPT